MKHNIGTNKKKYLMTLTTPISHQCKELALDKGMILAALILFLIGLKGQSKDTLLKVIFMEQAIMTALNFIWVVRCRSKRLHTLI